MGKRQHLERREGKLKAFIPSHLDDAGLSPAEFRVYCHLARNANMEGIAWSPYRRMIEITRLSNRTIRRCIETLEADHKLIQKIRKRFGEPCRYRLTAIVPPEGQKAASNSATRAPIEAASNSATRAPIEAAPIVPPEHPNSATRAPSIVPPEHHKGNPIKGIHLRVSNKEEIELPFSSDEFREAWNDWEQHRREIKKPLTSLAIKRQFKKIKAMGEAEAIASIDRSISARYSDIYLPNTKNKPDHREAKARREYPEPKAPLPML
jgi:hypothetical protein